MMSKKDYQAIARVLYCANRNVLEANTEHLTPRELATWAIGNVVSRIADVLAQDSPRFDRARFIEACETGADTQAAKRARQASKARLAAQRAAVR
jgi:hypothetical protein